MPKIEREIPYTLSAYSGGLAKDDEDEEMSNPDEDDRKSEGCRAKNHRWTAANRRKSKSPQKRSSGDVYDFNESEEEDPDKKEPEDLLNRINPCSEKASLLVAAALCAAEHDLSRNTPVPPEKVVIEPCSPPPKPPEEPKDLIEGREVTIVPHSPYRQTESPENLVSKFQVPQEEPFVATEARNSVDVIPIPNPSPQTPQMDARNLYLDSKSKQETLDKEEVEQRPGFASSSGMLPSYPGTYGTDPILDQAASFSNQLYQTGIENLSRAAASSYQASRSADYTEYASEASVYPGNMFNASSLDLSQSAAMNDLMTRSSYQSGAYNGGMINEHLLSVSTGANRQDERIAHSFRNGQQRLFQPDFGDSKRISPPLYHHSSYPAAPMYPSSRFSASASGGGSSQQQLEAMNSGVAHGGGRLSAHLSAGSSSSSYNTYPAYF